MSFRKNKVPVSSRRAQCPALPVSPSPTLGERRETENLQQRIDACYERLAEEPGDFAVRISLSWYLLFQAQNARCQQEIWTQLLGSTDVLDAALTAALSTIRKEMSSSNLDYQKLLRDSLKHASTVIQLSCQIQERNEAARIRELARELGENEAVLESDVEAKRILARMTRAMLTVNHEGIRMRGRHRSGEEEFHN